MDTPGVFKLTPQLFEAVLAGDDKRAAIIAADLKEAWTAPQTVKLYTDWYKGAAS